MVHFRRKSYVDEGSESSQGNQKNHLHQGSVNDFKVSKEDAMRLKVRTASVNDPILEAVQEAQPFEQAADTFKENMNRRSYFDTEDGRTVTATDVFGNVIHVPDISNPTRSRDERPLDTIRGFEYAATGDPSWIQQIETPFLGFQVRPDFPLSRPFNDYGQNSQAAMTQQAVYEQPKIDFDQDATKKKKKRNIFGRKKK